MIQMDTAKIIDESTQPGHNIKIALELNLRYQATLKEQLRRIEQAQQRNSELQVSNLFYSNNIVLFWSYH